MVAPRLVHRDLTGTRTGWTIEPLGDRLADLFHGDVGARWPLMAMAAAATIAFLVVNSRRRPFWVAAIVIPPVAYLLVAQAAAQSSRGALVTHQLADRGLAHTLVLACLPLAVLLGAGIDRASKSSLNHGRFLALSMIAVIPLQGPLLDTGNENASRPTAELRDVAAYLEDTMSPGYRFGFEHPDTNAREVTGVTSPGIWMAQQTGRPIINGLGFEVATVRRGSWLIDRLESQDPAEIADGLQRLGVSHVVTTNAASAENLIASERWEVAADFGPLLVWRIVADDNTTPRIQVGEVADAGQRQEFIVDPLPGGPPRRVQPQMAGSGRRHRGDPATDQRRATRRRCRRR